FRRRRLAKACGLRKVVTSKSDRPLVPHSNRQPRSLPSLSEWCDMSQAEMDAATRHVFSNPPMMAGEERADYEILKRMVLQDLKPVGVQEMLLARDIVDAEWELRRLRRLKPDILHAAIPRVVKAQVADAGEGVKLDARLVPNIRQRVIDMLAG